MRVPVFSLFKFYCTIYLLYSFILSKSQKMKVNCDIYLVIIDKDIIVKMDRKIRHKVKVHFKGSVPRIFFIGPRFLRNIFQKTLF